MILNPRVRAGWVAFNDPLEGHVDSLYLDTKDLETTADGILCDSSAAAQAMAWLKSDGTPASPAEVDAEWHRVKAMRPGLVWSRYRVGGFLHLAPEELERVTLQRLDADAEILAASWPSFTSWPWQAQAAAAALAWGCGPGAQRPGLTSPDWPYFHADVARRDWRACATSGQLSWTNGNAGVRPRDMAISALFLLAAGASWDEARAAWPADPVADVAAMALAGLGLPPDDFDAATTLPIGVSAVGDGE